jgi:hypothetical protein
MNLPAHFVFEMANQSQQDARAFRFRLRHDHLLQQRLREAKLKAVQDLAAELGYCFEIEDFKPAKRKLRSP